MENIVQELSAIISDYTKKFSQITDPDFSAKPIPLCAVLAKMPPENYTKECNTGGLHTLQWLAEDYVKHLKHHINQIISGSFGVIYK